MTLRLEGTASNRDAVGARVDGRGRRPAPGRRAVRRRQLSSAGDPRLHFGLGPADRVESVEVRWPSGRVDRYEGLAADTGYLLREGDPRAEAPRRVPTMSTTPSLSPGGQFGPRDVLLLSAWCGLAAGWLEVGTRVLCRSIDPTNRLYLMSRHFVWLVPLSNLMLFFGHGSPPGGGDEAVAPARRVAQPPTPLSPSPSCRCSWWPALRFTRRPG